MKTERNLKKLALSSVLLVAIFASMWRIYEAYSFVELNPAARPNILVVSVCSFRYQLLSLYGAINKDAAPNLEKFFAKSTFVFTNAYNGLGWTNLVHYTVADINSDTLFMRGYKENNRRSLGNAWRVPRYRDNPSAREKNYRPGLAEFKAELLQKHDKPFYMFVHFKYPHYPLIDRFNSDSEWDKFLTVEEKEKMIDYLNHPERYYRKLPLLLLLAHNPYHVLEHPRYKNKKISKDPAALNELLGLMTNDELLQEWKSSEGYAGDLQILNKIYRANIGHLDKILGPILDLYGNKDLQKNTIVLFAGDHGEAHMERDELTHAMSIWDNLLKVPMAIYFPNSIRHEKIDRQLDFAALSKVVKQLVLGRNTPAAFKAAIEEETSDVMIVRNCTNTLRGVRFKNKYKYFQRTEDGERFLYDLEKDPGEVHNVAAQHPDVVQRMEGLYWQNLGSVANAYIYPCVPADLL